MARAGASSGPPASARQKKLGAMFKRKAKAVATAQAAFKQTSYGRDSWRASRTSLLSLQETCSLVHSSVACCGRGATRRTTGIQRMSIS